MSTNSNNAKANFRANLKAANLANIYEMQGVFYADDLPKARNQYMSLPRSRRSAARSQAYIASSRMQNSTARILAWYVAALRSGYSGICSTNDETAETIAAAKQCKLSGRTVSRSNGELQRAGFIVLKPMPTGNTVQIRGRHVTKRVNQVIFTPQLKLLIGDLSHISRPSPKGRTTLAGINQKGSIGRSPSDLIQVDNDKIKQGPPIQERGLNPLVKCKSGLQQISGPLEKENSTPPASPPSAAPRTVEQQPLQNGRQGGRRPQVKRPNSGRVRKSKPLTWTALRLAFLSELESNLDVASCQTEQREILKLAKIQTAQNFPPLIPTPVNWNRIIWDWKGATWHERRKYLRHILIPQLSAAVAGLLPADRGRPRPHARRREKPG